MWRQTFTSLLDTLEAWPVHLFCLVLCLKGLLHQPHVLFRVSFQTLALSACLAFFPAQLETVGKILPCLGFVGAVKQPRGVLLPSCKLGLRVSMGLTPVLAPSFRDSPCYLQGSHMPFCLVSQWVTSLLPGAGGSGPPKPCLLPGPAGPTTGLSTSFLVSLNICLVENKPSQRDVVWIQGKNILIILGVRHSKACWRRLRACYARVSLQNQYGSLES